MRRVGSGKRLPFGREGEEWLTEWMAEHAPDRLDPTSPPLVPWEELILT
jgi:hypothetical protein